MITNNIETAEIDTGAKDIETAKAFAKSWNNLPTGSVYDFEQFKDWFAPLTENDIKNKLVLELGCGNGSLLVHVPRWNPKYLKAIDLGDSVLSCQKNMQQTGFDNYSVTQHDLTTFESDGYDLVYSIGVLHHLKNPLEGFKAVLKNTKTGGKFHCWVYAEEGNAVVITLVDPIRKVVSKFPWWVIKYFVATPLVVPYFTYAKIISKFKVFKNLPLYEYSQWIAKREFSFFRHVAFDQLVTPQTTYISKRTVENWIINNPEIDQQSIYIINRNGNSWKFGGIKI